MNETLLFQSVVILNGGILGELAVRVWQEPRWTAKAVMGTPLQNPVLQWCLVEWLLMTWINYFILIWAHSDSFQALLWPVAAPQSGEEGDGKIASNSSRPPLQGGLRSNSSKAGWIQASKGWWSRVSLSGWALLKIEFPPQQPAPLKPSRSFGGGV